MKRLRNAFDAPVFLWLVTDVELVQNILQRCPDAVTSERITLLSGDKLSIGAVNAAVIELKRRGEITGSAFQDANGDWGGIQIAD